jgi:hypothetical protein
MLGSAPFSHGMQHKGVLMVARSKAEFVEIAAAGGGFDLRKTKTILTVSDLTEIAAAASRHRAIIRIDSTGKSTADLLHNSGGRQEMRIV